MTGLDAAFDSVSAQLIENVLGPSFDVRVEDGVIQVTGIATVPDGALVTWEYDHALEGASGAPCPFPPPDPDPCQAAGEVEVNNCVFLSEVPRMAAGDIDVFLAFQTILGGTVHQPQEIIDLYGENGENITGVQVTDTGASLYRVEWTTIVIIRDREGGTGSQGDPLRRRRMW